MARSITRLLGWTVAVVLAGLLFVWAWPGMWQRGAAAEPMPRQVSARSALLPQEQATIDLFETARPSVVYITTQARVLDIFYGFTRIP